MPDSFDKTSDRVTHLTEHLVIHENQGVLKFDSHRMMLLSATAFGHLRSELISSLGQDIARGMLKRFGYQAGFHDGHALSLRYPELSIPEQMHLGTVLHQKEGIARIEGNPNETEVDLEKGILKISSHWHNSLEAEQHVARFGETTFPVCWMLQGYASGHLSFLLQRAVIAHETECMAQGASCCSFVVRFKEDLARDVPDCDEDYKTIDLSAMHKDLEARIHEQDMLIKQLQGRLERVVGDQSPSQFDALIGESASLCKSVSIARSVAKVDSTVLINGESGTGKEIFAQCIVGESNRRTKPFLTVNCATLTESLQNAELFGYMRGAFTGATTDRAGLFEQANGGSLFLDEVGELSMGAQAALLRVLQEGKLKRVGDTRERSVDVRIIAATHRDLETMIAEGRFREDLYFRLNVICFEVPPLRERDHDVLLLARHFLKLFNRQFEKEIEGISADATRRLLEHPWPGNVRELRNAMERATLLASGNMIQLEDFPPNLKDCKLAGGKAKKVSNHDERTVLLETLAQHHYNREATAEAMGISRATLWRRMKKYEIGGR